MKPPRRNSALPPRAHRCRLHLNAFRGEPAISVFDWHFTPTHNSSGSFATLIGSALHALLRALQPGHGWLTRFQVRCMLPMRAIHARVRLASGCHCLRRQHTSTRRVILQKARDHACTKKVPSALTAWTRVVSGSISLPSPGYFSPFPHGTVHYRSRHVACLGPWSAQLPTRFLVFGGTRDPRHSHMHRRYGTVTRSGMPFQALRVASYALLQGTHPLRQVSQPQLRNACMLGT